MCGMTVGSVPSDQACVVHGEPATLLPPGAERSHVCPTACWPRQATELCSPPTGHCTWGVRTELVPGVGRLV